MNINQFQQPSNLKQLLREHDIIETIGRGTKDLGQVLICPITKRKKIAFNECTIDLQQWDNNLMSRGFELNHIICIRRPEEDYQKIRKYFLEAPVEWNLLTNSKTNIKDEKLDENSLEYIIRKQY